MLDPEVVTQLLVRRRPPAGQALHARAGGARADGRGPVERPSPPPVVTESAVGKHVNNIFIKLDLPPADSASPRAGCAALPLRRPPMTARLDRGVALSDRRRPGPAVLRAARPCRWRAGRPARSSRGRRVIPGPVGELRVHARRGDVTVVPARGADVTIDPGAGSPHAPACAVTSRRTTERDARPLGSSTSGGDRATPLGSGASRPTRRSRSRPASGDVGAGRAPPARPTCAQLGRCNVRGLSGGRAELETASGDVDAAGLEARRRYRRASSGDVDLGFAGRRRTPRP